MKKTILFLAIIIVGCKVNGQVVPVSDEQLFKAFKQDIVQFEGWLSMFGGGGNCASVAIIKSSIGTFGLNGVFKNVRVDSSSEMVYVTRRDNKIIDLTFDRLQDGEDHFFITRDSTSQISLKISDYAAFCFAVMCRGKQLELGYDRTYFYRGVDKLNKGQDASEIYKLLGLQKVEITDLSFNNLKNYKNIILYNALHAVYSSNGNYDEFFRGTVTGIEPLSRLNFFHCRTLNGCPILGAYTLR